MIWKTKNRRDGLTYWHVRYEWSPGRCKQEGVPPNLDGRPVSRQDAIDFLTKRKAEVNAGVWTDPHAEPVPEPEADRGPLFSEFAATFLMEHPGRRRSDHYTRTVAQLVKHFGPMRLREITRADLDRYRVLLQTTRRPGRPIPKRLRVPGGPERTSLPPLNATTVLKRLRTLHRMFRLAVRWGVLDSNPAADLEKPSPAKGKLRFLSRDEYDRLEAAAPPWLRPMIRMAVCTGMRLKEVALLKWEDIDEQGGTLYVAQDTKTGTRAIPMTEAAKAVLADLKAERKEAMREAGRIAPGSLFVFVDDTEADYTSDRRRQIVSEETRAAGRAAALDGSVGYHVLRHTAASWMVQRGVPLYEVQKVLGHSSSAMTERYAHLQLEHLRAAGRALDDALGIGAAPVAESRRESRFSVASQDSDPSHLRAAGE